MARNWTDENGRRERSSIAQTRSALYRSARVLGDIQAIKAGRVGARIRRRIVGRLLSRFVR
jgi:hypothetical protein